MQAQASTHTPAHEPRMRAHTCGPGHTPCCRLVHLHEQLHHPLAARHRRHVNAAAGLPAHLERPWEARRSFLPCATATAAAHIADVTVAAAAIADVAALDIRGCTAVATDAAAATVVGCAAASATAASAAPVPVIYICIEQRQLHEAPRQHASAHAQPWRPRRSERQHAQVPKQRARAAAAERPRRPCGWQPRKAQRPRALVRRGELQRAQPRQAERKCGRMHARAHQRQRPRAHHVEAQPARRTDAAGEKASVHTSGHLAVVHAAAAHAAVARAAAAHAAAAHAAVAHAAAAHAAVAHAAACGATSHAASGVSTACGAFAVLSHSAMPLAFAVHSSIHVPSGALDSPPCHFAIGGWAGAGGPVCGVCNGAAALPLPPRFLAALPLVPSVLPGAQRGRHGRRHQVFQHRLRHVVGSAAAVGKADVELSEVVWEAVGDARHQVGNLLAWTEV
eukprot:366186-Chlamydomonas_euryale.AAC.1